MKKHTVFVRLFAVLLIFASVLTLSACTPAGTPDESTSGSAGTTADPSVTTADPSVTTAPPAPSTDPVNVTVLNGTTGFGMAKLMKDNADGKANLSYKFDVQADASNVLKALINGSTDIAALPTNAAATVYNKTNGGVQVLALNTLGVLYVVSRGELPDLDMPEGEVSRLEQLRGKTVYCPANNPAIVFSAICEANGLKVGTDLTVDTSYAEPAAVRAALVSGEIDLAVLPEPMVTIAQKADTSLTVAFDLTEEWDAKFPAGSLTQGCVVVRTEFAKSHPVELEAFLTEYAASIAFMKENPSEAATVIVEQGVFAGAAPIAAAAIPKCNVTFLKGAEMKAALSVFLETLHGIDPTAVGGKVPADDFYYGAE